MPDPVSAPVLEQPATPIPAAETPTTAPIPPVVQPTPGARVAGEPTAVGAPAKRKSAFDRLKDDLAKKARPSNAPDGEPSPAATPESPTVPKPTDKPAEGAGATPAPEAGDKGKKVNPWKLIDDYKGRIAAVEKQLAEAKTTSLSEQERSTLTERATKAETRLKALEDDLFYTHYQKSDEFLNKYQKPYENAWKRAMDEIGELAIQDDSSGETRPATAKDLLGLVNLPLGKAKEEAQRLFGDFADDVMSYRKEIRGLFDQQQQALDEARKNGADRERQKLAEAQQTQKQTADTITKTWAAANQAALEDEKHGQYFKPVEGNEEINQRLGKGFQLADRAFSENPLAPGLNAEQRAAIVKRHAAVRNRAAAFGALVYRLQTAQAKIDSLQKELNEFKGGEPGAGGAPSGSAPQAPAKPMDRLFGELRKRAVRS